MRLQRQTKFGGEEGNCFATCIACLLGMDVDDVPNFCTTQDWYERAQSWLAPKGLMLITYNGDPFSEAPEYRERAIMIASGQGPRGPRHAVLWRNGELFHDPHPSSDGLVGEPEEYEFLVVLDATAFSEWLLTQRARWTPLHEDV